MKVIAFILLALCLSIHAAPTINWTGTWKLKADSARGECCFPKDSLVVDQKEGIATTTGTWGESDHCNTAELKGKPLDSREQRVNDDNLLHIAYKNKDQDESATLTKNSDGTAAYAVKDKTCTATFEEVKTTDKPTEQPAEDKPEDWTGFWKLKAGSTSGTCCFPKEAIRISQKDGFANVFGTWDTSSACNGLTIGNKRFQSKEKIETANVLPVKVRSNKKEQTFTLTRNPDGSAAYAVKDTECKATFELDEYGKAWRGLYEVTPDAGSKDTCCFPKTLFVGRRQNEANELPIHGKWTGEAPCRTLEVADKNFTGAATFDATTLTPTFKDHEGQKTFLPGSKVTKNADKLELTYKASTGKTENAGEGEATEPHTCKATLTLKPLTPRVKKEKTSQNQASKENTTKKEKSAKTKDPKTGKTTNDDKKPFLGPLGYAGIAVAALLVIIVAVFLYRRQQAAKLRETLLSGNQGLIAN